MVNLKQIEVGNTLVFVKGERNIPVSVVYGNEETGFNCMPVSGDQTMVSLTEENADNFFLPYKQRDEIKKQIKTAFMRLEPNALTDLYFDQGFMGYLPTYQTVRNLVRTTEWLYDADPDVDKGTIWYWHDIAKEVIMEWLFGVGAMTPSRDKGPLFIEARRIVDIGFGLFSQKSFLDEGANH